MNAIRRKLWDWKTVEFEIPFDALSFVDAECCDVVEPGEFEIMIGPSSRNEDMLTSHFAACC